MTHHEVYRDLEGREFVLTALEADERKLLVEIRQFAATQPEWHDFDNYWLQRVRELYDTKGLSRKESIQTPVFQIAQDLSSRIAVAAGLARLPDYRDQLQWLARERFKSRREFCEAAGMTEEVFRALCAGRQHLSMETLMQVLQRLGCTLRIVPLADLGVAANGALAAAETSAAH